MAGEAGLVCWLGMPSGCRCWKGCGHISCGRACLLARHAFRLPMLEGLRPYQLWQGRPPFSGFRPASCWKVLAKSTAAGAACLLAQRPWGRCRWKVLAKSTAAGALLSFALSSPAFADGAGAERACQKSFQPRSLAERMRDLPEESLKRAVQTGETQRAALGPFGLSREEGRAVYEARLIAEGETEGAAISWKYTEHLQEGQRQARLIAAMKGAALIAKGETAAAIKSASCLPNGHCAPAQLTAKIRLEDAFQDKEKANIIFEAIISSEQLKAPPVFEGVKPETNREIWRILGKTVGEVKALFEHSMQSPYYAPFEDAAPKGAGKDYPLRAMEKLQELLRINSAQTLAELASEAMIMNLAPGLEEFSELQEFLWFRNWMALIGNNEFSLSYFTLKDIQAFKERAAEHSVFGHIALKEAPADAEALARGLNQR